MNDYNIVFELAKEFSLKCFLLSSMDEIKDDALFVLNNDIAIRLSEISLERNSPIIWISKLQTRVAVFPVNDDFIFILSKSINGYVRSMDKGTTQYSNKYYEYDLRIWEKAFRTIYLVLYGKSYGDLLYKLEINPNRVDEEELYMKYSKFKKNDYEVLEELYNLEDMCIEYISQLDEFGIVQLFENFTSGFIVNLNNMIYENSLDTAKVFAISIFTVARRAAISNGLEQVAASTMFCLYVEQLSGMNNEEEIDELIISCCLDYIIKIKDLRHVKKYSEIINEAICFIHNNIYNRILMDDIAESVGISTSYFMKLFREEVSIKVSTYINLTKIDEAKRLLRFSSLTINEISQLLMFSTQSYFTKIFKDEVKMTPYEYRNNRILIK